MNTFRSLAPALAVSILVAACTSLPTAAPGALTATEARYRASELEGKEVTVRGYITLEFENNSLWASPNDADNLRQSNCLGLGVPDDMRDYRLNNHWVTLRGKLHVFPKNTIFLNGCAGVGLELTEKPVRIAKPET
jgi:hypothetical protein